MIRGIGIDLVDVADLERRLRKGPLERVFSARELAYAENRLKRRSEILAARWAAKEAFGKALGTGLRAEWRLAEIEVVRDDNGSARLILSGQMRELVGSTARIHLSLTHTPTVAGAVVVIEEPPYDAS
jgi:holo-[acyl-carrier protein] synthase